LDRQLIFCSLWEIFLAGLLVINLDRNGFDKRAEVGLNNQAGLDDRRKFLLNLVLVVTRLAPLPHPSIQHPVVNKKT
jgi:hypothetical protein